MRIAAVFIACLGLTACVETTTTPPSTSAPASRAQAAGLSEAQFASVIRRMEPVSEQACRELTSNVNCDFKIVLNRDPRQPSNAWQSVDKTGRPVLTFTQALLDDLGNADELAFIVGHEAAHHIEGHLSQKQQSAVGGAILGTVLGAALGADPSSLQSIQELGASVGARVYSKDYELEADQLGTIITHRGGYDPVRGAEFFNRIPDPGDQFLGSHPPNGSRMAIVRETAARL